MDFDPGMFSEDDIDDMSNNAYGEGYEDALDEQAELNYEPEPEEASDVLDDEYDTVDLAVAAGFGYHMASDELEERKIAKKILDRKKKNKIQKVSLRNRKSSGVKGSPSKRWMFEVASGQKKAKDPVEYTDEEKKAILEYEGEHDFEL